MTALPTTKLEAWRYTDLRAISSTVFAPPPPPVTPEFPALDIPRLVFLNGAFAADLSAQLPFAEKFAPVTETTLSPLASINAAQAQDGVTLDIPAGIDAGAVLLLAHNAGAAPFAIHPRHRITLAENASLTIIEICTGAGLYWHNPVVDIALAPGAKLSHYRLQTESLAAFNLTTIRAHIAANAAYEHFTATIGAQLSRTEIHAHLAGPAATAHLNAANLLTGTQLGDFTSIIHHAAPNCPSRQTVKSVLAGQSRGVFQGRIEVDRIAQKTDGYQMSQALLLSPEAEMDIKPELQIFADDVKCSHGATIGALDEEQVFYLRSRGIPEPQARAMLIRAFLEEALEPVQHEGAKTLFEAAIENWWITQ